MSSLIEANIVERMDFCNEFADVNYRRGQEETWFSTGIPYPNPFLNIIFQIPQEPYYLDHKIDQIVLDAHQPGAPLFLTINALTENPDRLDRQLQMHHLAPVESVWGMAVDLKYIPADHSCPPGFTIERVQTEEQLEQFIHILTDQTSTSHHAFTRWVDFEAQLGLNSTSPWQRYLGLWNGEPVATSALFMGTATAGIYHVATLPLARGQGIGTTLTSYALGQAHLRGHQTSVLISTPMAFNAYRRLGFDVYSKLHVFMLTSWN